MTHLTDREFVDLVEARLPADRRSHVERCGRCQTRVGQLRSTLEATAMVDVPEPSPLFWDHLSARIMDGIGHASSPTAVAAWLGLRPRSWMAVAALAVAAGAALSQPWRTGEAPGSPAPASPPALVATTPEPALDLDSEMGEDLDADEAWAVVRTVADDTDWGEEDAREAGIAPRPGWADRAAFSLTTAELHELAQLLERELRLEKGA
jgi:hypothetical protein